MAFYQKIIAFIGSSQAPFPLATAPGMGAVDYTQRAALKCAADGSILACSPKGGAAGPVVSVVRNGAGDYTVTLAATIDAASVNQLAPELTCNTTLLNGSAVMTDATHIAVKTRTDAGVATDSAFTLVLHVLDL